jgi:ribokinase
MKQQQEPSKSTPQVVVVGSINMDMVARSVRLPAPGETLVGEGFDMSPGGKGANQAVAAARLGAPTAFVGRLGTRLHGDDLLGALAAEGVDCSGVAIDTQALPGIAVIMVASAGGENSIVYVPGSNAQLDSCDVQAASTLLQRARVVVAQLEVPMPAIEAAFALAREAGVVTVLNAAPALQLSESLLALCDWLVLNEIELEELSPGAASLESAADVLLARGARQLLVTLGAQGVLWCSPEGCHTLPTRAVQAIDTVGAGDTFLGGFAAGLAEGLSPQQAIRLGQAAAAIAVSRSGVQSAMPRRDEIGSLEAA